MKTSANSHQTKRGHSPSILEHLWEQSSAIELASARIVASWPDCMSQAFSLRIGSKYRSLGQESLLQPRLLRTTDRSICSLAKSRSSLGGVTARSRAKTGRRCALCSGPEAILSTSTLSANREPSTARPSKRRSDIGAAGPSGLNMAVNVMLCKLEAPATSLRFTSRVSDKVAPRRN